MFETHGMLNKRSGSYSSLQSGNRRAILKAWGTCSSSSDSRLKQEEVQGLLSTDSSSNPEEVRRFIGSDEKRECPSPARSHFANDFSSRSGSSTASLTIQIETAGFKVPDSMEASQRYDILNWLISNQFGTIMNDSPIIIFTADGMSYPRKGVIGKDIALEDKMDCLINFLQKKEGREPVV